MIIIGKGKHAEVCKSIAERIGYKCKIIPYEELDKYRINTYCFIGVGDNHLRRKIFMKYPKLNYINLIDPNAIIIGRIKMGTGNLICPGVIIQSGTIIGNHNIINTRASIDHHNKIGNFVHICPNVTSCGSVNINDFTTIGPSSTISNYTSITNNCIIGASSLVLDNIDVSGKYWGIPCKFIDPNTN